MINKIKLLWKVKIVKKNFMSVLIVIISLICVVGCGSKNRTLECIKTTDDSSGFQIKETYSYSFVSGIWN